MILLFVLGSSLAFNYPQLLPLSQNSFGFPLNRRQHRNKLHRYQLGQQRRIHQETQSIESSNIKLNAVSETKTVVLDGSEYTSLQSFLKSTQDGYVPGAPPRPGSQVYGYFSIATGTIDTGKRVVGIVCPSEYLGSEKKSKQKKDSNNLFSTVKLDNTTHIFNNSIAIIPEGISDADAISTSYASIVGVHCAFIPKLNDIGGSKDKFRIDGGSVVVVGGADFSCFVAE